MTQNTAEIPVEKIRPNPFQPRLHFPETAQRELQESIRRNGLIQPITVRQNGEEYELLAGERRFRAVSDLGLPTISAYVRVLSDEEMRTLSIIENVQREELNPIDLARSYRSLANDLGFSQEKIASQIGKNRSTVANTLRLLELPEDIQKLVSGFRLSSGHARALLPLKDSSRLKGFVDRLIENDWSVRQTERKVKSLLEGKGGGTGVSTTKKITNVKDPNVRALEEQLASHLQTQVEIWGETEGSIQIHFTDVREFNRVFNMILEEEREEEDDFEGEEDFPEDSNL